MNRFRPTSRLTSNGQLARPVKLLLFCLTGLVLAATPVACATTSTTSTTWTAEDPPPWARYGRVSWVREVVQRQEGNPAGGALAGALIGGLLGGGRGPGAVVGAVGGAAVGAAASSGSMEHRRYEVMVTFDDGTYQVFVYPGGSPFHPGQVVMQTAQGLSAAGP
jgi:outer membrane lipoprotein SlyB